MIRDTDLIDMATNEEDHKDYILETSIFTDIIMFLLIFIPILIITMQPSTTNEND